MTTTAVALSGEITFQDQDVRSVMLDGEPWFVAADVCAVLEIAKTDRAVAKLDDDEMPASVHSPARRQRSRRPALRVSCGPPL